MYGRLLYMSFTLVAAVGTALVYWLGGRMVIQGGLELGTIVAFTLYLGRLFGPIAGLSNIPIDVKTALVSFDRVFEVLDFPSSIKERLGAYRPGRAQGQGRVRRRLVQVPGRTHGLARLPGGGPDRLRGRRGSDESWILEGVSLHGRSRGRWLRWSGPRAPARPRSPRWFPVCTTPPRGAVRLDGIDVKDLTLQSVADAVGTVPQDVHLFHDTIRNNLAYARPEATEEEIVEATRAAQIYDLIESLPDGLDTMVGERGYRLSGGEKQRLAIARLLLKDPAVVILDEATAHLDSESEVLIQRALGQCSGG